MAWINDDGLTVLMHGEQGEVKDQGTTAGAKRTLVVEIPDATLIPTSAATPAANDPFLPAGAYVTRATLLVDTAFTSGGSATMTIGTYTKAGGTIDADGIDAAIALTAIDAAQDAVACDGAQVGGVVRVGAADAYVQLNYGTAAYTAGAAKLVIEYIV